MNARIEEIFESVVTHGVQLDDYYWTYNGTDVQLIDNGKAVVVTWGPRMQTYCYEYSEPEFNYGSEEDLEILYNGILNNCMEL
jgi:hypothetical protein